MRTTFEFGFEYIKNLVKQHSRLFQSLRYLYYSVFGGVQKVQIYEISGLVKNSGNRMTTLFVGKEYSAHQFASLVYCQIDKILLFREFRFNQIVSALSTNTPEIIAVNVKKPTASEFEKLGYLLLPNVTFSLDLRRPIDQIIRKMSRRRRRDIKKIESFNYPYTICRGNDEDFNFFYWKMYLPYAVERFGKGAYVRTYNESKALYRGGGGIIFIRKFNKPVAGILFRTVGKTLYALSIGLCQLSEKFAEHLAGQAVLFYLIKWAKMQGLESLDYGITLPFFREGIFMYKKEWGMHVEKPIDQSFFALKFNSLNAGSFSFLEQNPFIILDNGMFKGVVFLNHKPSKEELHQIFSEYFLPKLSSLVFVACYKSNTEVLDKAELSTKPSGPPDVLAKPLLDICSLQRNAFKVEVLELWGLDQKQISIK